MTARPTAMIAAAITTAKATAAATSNSATRSAALLIALLVAPACGPQARERTNVEGLGLQRTMLSEGYSMLYTDASKINYLDLVLYVKKDSKEFDSVVNDIAAYGADFAEQLKRAAKQYPGVRIDLDPLPEMENRKRAAIARDRLVQFAPFSGHGRAEFERTLLIGLSNALNHEAHLCKVMAEEEPDPQLKALLKDADRRWTALAARALGLLEREYFRSNADAGGPR